MTSPTASTPPRCFLHIGLQKTGTSYLQAVFWRSQEALAAQALAMLPATKAETFEVMLGVREQLGERAADDPLDVLARQLDDALAHGPAATFLLSQESLAPATAAQAEVLVDRLRGVEPHVVLTVRDLARQLPSVWQQKLSARRRYTFDDYLDAVVDRKPKVRDFWDSQDVPAVLDRWSRVVPAERIHVVTVPPAGSPPGLLLDRFCEVLGVRPESLDREVPRRNASLGRGQAELLRRVNVALGDRLAGREANRPVKLYFAKRVLAAQPGRPTLAPARLEAWCREVAEEHIEALAGGGYDVVGDLADLRPSSRSFTDADQEADEAEVLDAAAEALATMLVDRQRVAQRRRRRPKASSDSGRLRRRLRRVLAPRRG